MDKKILEQQTRETREDIGVWECYKMNVLQVKAVFFEIVCEGITLVELSP